MRVNAAGPTFVKRGIGERFSWWAEALPAHFAELQEAGLPSRHMT